MKARFLIISFFLLGSLSSFAPSPEGVKTLADFAKDEDDIFLDHIIVQSELERSFGKAIADGAVSADDLRPKKVGLISTYLFEERFNFRKSHILYIYSKQGELDYFYHQIADPAVGGLKKAFADSNVELLMPEDYLKSQGDRRRYTELANEIQKLQVPFNATVKKNGLKPAANDFEFIYSMAMDGLSPKVANELATFADKMKLDAVLTMEIATEYRTSTINLSSINLVLHGVNELERINEQGVLYNTYSFFPDYYYPLVTIQGGKTFDEQYEGMDVILERIGEDYLKYVDESIDELF
ncbi:MAG: hypothetical protein AAGA85_26410 [Bacteroidota bacterium]